MSRMHRFDWLARQRTYRCGRNPHARRLHVEPLEDRRMLAVLTVNSALDNITPGDNLVTLREAITAANNDATTDLGETGSGADTILFDATVFATPQTIPLALDEIVIAEAITIDATALAGNVTLDAQLQSRIFNITATTGDITLAGLTLVGGQLTGDNASASDSTFGGGAIRSLTTDNLTLDRVIVHGNTTVGFRATGGGIFSTGALTITRSTVSGNNTTDGTSAHGGGILSKGDVSLIQSTVSGNSVGGASAAGGGILSYGTVALTNSTVSGNGTTGNNAEGGGIFAFGAVTVTLSTISGNSTTGGGSSDGGGIYARGAVTLTQSTITDNRANDASSTGGGIWNDNDAITISGSIVAGNSAGGGLDDIDAGTGTFNVDFSLTSGDPMLGPLTNHGGPTQTHALLAGSLAIDAGDPTIAFDPSAFDQRGAPFVRVADGGAFGLVIDIGATERQTVPGLNLTVDTSVDEDDGDYSAGDLSLREAIALANGNVGADTILFDATLFATLQTISLTQGELIIVDALNIDGPSGLILTINGNLASRIFNINDGDNLNNLDVTIDGLILTGGLVSGSGQDGGAIFSRENLTVTNSTITGNSAVGSFRDGGGIYAAGGLTLVDSTITGNSAGEQGGGIYAVGGDLTILRSTISGNQSVAAGGGVYAINTNFATITESMIIGNSTAGDSAHGGGVFSSGDVTLTSSTISGNSTAGFNAKGGGILSYGNVALAGSTVSGNSTAGNFAFGGAIYSSADLTLTQSTVSGNNTAGSGAAGGGIFSVGAVTLTGSTVSENGTMGDFADGGGLISFGAVTLTGSSTVSDNSTAGDNAEGGGISSNGDVMLTGSSTVSGNSTAGENADGGGIYSTGDVTLTGSSTVSGNSTTGDNARGGGIRSLGAVTLMSSTVSGNSTTGKYADGGGIFSTGNVTLTSSTVSENSTARDFAGGGGIFSDGNVTLTSSTVSGNSTAGSSADGGGIYSSGDLTLTQSTVSGNSTAGFNAHGGGTYPKGDVTLTSSTVSGNSTMGDFADGGGIYNNNDAITITNSIVAGNSASGDMQDIEPGFGTLTVNFSLIGTGVTPDGGFGNNVRSNIPMLGLLANNGGPTETRAPLPGSPAIDAGGSLTTPPDFDQRGAPFVRVFDDPATAGSGIDIGALEVQPIASSADFDSDGDRDGRDFLFWQRGFGTPMPNATKSDGDADNDLDVDGDDLDIWEGQFGLAAPVVAAGSALNSASPTSGDLVDLALAVAFAEKANDAFGAREVAAHSPQPGFVSRPEPYALASGNATSQLENNMPEASAYGSDDDRESPEDSSPWEYALDEVFASAFD